jgi:hypothetical protein
MNESMHTTSPTMLKMTLAKIINNWINAQMHKGNVWLTPHLIANKSSILPLSYSSAKRGVALI